jgi:hypothetical protein
MKRTTLARVTPLKAKTGLSRKTPLRQVGRVARASENSARREPGTTNRKRPAPLRPVSPKRAKENRERSRLIRELYGDHRPRCARPGCPRVADDVHEILPRARGGPIADPSIWAPLCRPDHDEATREAGWAYQAGLLFHSWQPPAAGVVAAWQTAGGRLVREAPAGGGEAA